MFKKCSGVILVSIGASIALLSHAEEAVIDSTMAATLQQFNPRFEARKPEDYTPTIRKDAAKNRRQPYAVKLDFNEDGKIDVVVDGHDDKQSLLLCLLSTPQGYDVVVIRVSILVDPEEVENWNDGEQEYGLNYYLWPHETAIGFTLAFPQQSDPEGQLLNDGAMIDYVFANGAFHESHQTL